MKETHGAKMACDPSVDVFTGMLCWDHVRTVLVFRKIGSRIG